MKKLRVLDLFSGIGGFSLGLERTGGFETVAFCEINPFCQAVLEKNFPGVEIHTDVTRLKFRKNVGLVTAGFPCQDASLAGDGAGITGERTGLFWYIIRTLCMVGRPKALLENVAALLDRGMGVVLGALASFGYDAEWHCVPASYVGAWHRRDRVWIFANPNCDGRQQGGSPQPILRQFNLHEQSQRSFARWPGRPNLPKPRVCGRANGVPKRLHALGNSVIPQIPEMIGYAILESLKEKQEAA